MDVLKKAILLFGSTLVLSGCHLSYIIKSGYHQAKILTQGEDFEKVYATPSVPETTKQKLKLIEQTKAFAENDLGLARTKNYTQFVQLEGPYVSYVVSASQRWSIDAKKWSFPIVGEVPYKGFFSPEEAKEEATNLANENLDVFVRGVSAYSTLGYFRDPVLSSMLSDTDHDLVALILHETVHSTLWIKNNAGFNERLAVFLGNKGAIAYYQKKEGKDSTTAKRILLEEADEALFSKFITKEIDSLKTWYQQNQNANEGLRQQRLKEIRTRFTSDLKPKLKTDSYDHFPERALNNAHLVNYDTYYSGLQDFERVWEKEGRDFKRTLESFKKLEKSDDPIRDLATL
jgi:predicted aminopeptidase